MQIKGKGLTEFDAAGKYFPGATPIVKPLGTGIVNDTYVVKFGVKSFVLQRLNLMFDDSTVRDNVAISNFLAKKGWEMNKMLRDGSGNLFLRETNGRLWRCQTFLEADVWKPEMLTGSLAVSAAELIARWHLDVAKLHFTPEYHLPHFRDTAYYARRLKSVSGKLPDDDSRILAGKVLKAYATLPKLPAKPKQIIHGDPQLKNMLFRKGKPFTLIDLDTVMVGSVLWDLGDFLRSILEADLTFDIKPSIESYRRVARRDSNPNEFREQAITATKLIALELTMRFLNDIVDDSYFTWDSGKFETRRDNHMHLAQVQWDIYEAL